MSFSKSFLAKIFQDCFDYIAAFVVTMMTRLANVMLSVIVTHRCVLLYFSYRMICHLVCLSKFCHLACPYLSCLFSLCLSLAVMCLNLFGHCVVVLIVWCHVVLLLRKIKMRKTFEMIIQPWVGLIMSVQFQTYHK